MNRNIDRRIRRTRQLIQNALFALMKEMPYPSIRISQITERADISRSTFYLHYETNDDLLLSIVGEIIDEYFQAIDGFNSASAESPAFLLFSKWKQNLEKMRLVLDAGMEFHIYQRLRSFNDQRSVSLETGNRLLNDYIRTMLDGASFALLIRWTKDNAKVPVRQMDQLFNGLNIPELFRAMEEQLPDFGS